MLIGEGDCPEILDTGKRGPTLFTLCSGPGGAARSGDYHQPSAFGHVAEAEHRAIEGRSPDQAPGLAAVIGGGDTRPRMRMPRGEVSSGHDTIRGVPERDGKSAGRRVGHQRRVVRMPGLPAVGGRQYPGDAGASGGDPGTLLALGRDTGAAGGKTEFTREGPGQPVSDILPMPAVGYPEHRETAVDRIAERAPPLRSPEVAAVVERILFFILALQRPGASAVGGLVN